MNEPEMYNTNMSSSMSKRDYERINLMVLEVITIHLHKDHGMGIREIAKRFGVRMKMIKEILDAHI